MPKTVKPLTDRQIKSAKPKDKPYKLFDGSGLYLEVRKTGKKVFRLKFNNKTITIGNYPAVSLSEARDYVLNKNRQKSKLSSISFKDVCDEFFEKKKYELSEKHFKTQKRRIEMYMYNILDMSINDIEKKMRYRYCKMQKQTN